MAFLLLAERGMRPFLLQQALAVVLTTFLTVSMPVLVHAEITCASILTPQTSPASFRSHFNQYKSLDQIPFISLESYDSVVEETKETGMGTEKILRASRNGREYFVKVSKARVDRQGLPLRTLEDILNEASWANGLNSYFGLGPKFYGVTIYEGRYALIFDWSQGFHLHEGLHGAPFRLIESDKQKIIHEMTNTVKTLIDADVDPIDIQFRLSDEGKAILIDTESFRFVDPGERQHVVLRLENKLRSLVRVVQQLK